ncbi:MAG: ATPase, partial [Treponema sp.]|nr:ATPase [Treponema sp.]
MAVAINITQLKRLLEITPESQNIMLTGKHGIGKSQILKQFFEERGQKVVILFLGQMSDPGDLIGLPHLNEKTGRTDFMLPYWFPTDGKPI